MDPGSHQRCSISLFLCYRLLDYGASQSLVWPSRLHLHILSCLLCFLLLYGSRESMVEFVSVPVPPGFSSGGEIDNYPSIWCRMRTGYHSRSAGDDVADVDGVRDHVGIHSLGCIYGRAPPEFPRIELAVDAGLYGYPVSLVSFIQWCDLGW